MVHVWKLEDNSWELVLSLLHVDPGDGSRVIRVGGNCLSKYRCLGFSSGNANLADPEENPDFWYFASTPGYLDLHVEPTYMQTDSFIASKLFKPPYQFLSSHPALFTHFSFAVFHFISSALFVHFVFFVWTMLLCFCT